MENAALIAMVMGPASLVMGLSIFIHLKSWQKILEKWEDDHFALFPIMEIELFLGLLIITFYNVWEWNVWLIITVMGWGALGKGLFFFLGPASWIKTSLRRRRNPTNLYMTGTFELVIGAVLTYHAYFA